MENIPQPSEQERLLSKIEQSLVAAFDWALGIESEEEEVEVLGEIYSYASVEGLDTEVIDNIYEKAFREEK